MGSYVRLCVVALPFLAPVLRAQSQEVVQRLADMDLVQLQQIPVISAARHEQNRAQSPRSVSVITAEEIRRRNFRDVPEAVAGLTGVFLQQTNYAGGSPILRGMVGNRILIMVNGIRLNNGTTRLGPNQYLNFLDINQVERIEVVRGAGSVLYGSDAFGGVINVITKSAPDALMGSEFGAGLRVRYGSADQSGAGRVSFSGATHKLGFIGGYTQEGFGDLRAGKGEGVQPYTGYTQWAGDLQLRYALGPDRSLVVGASRLRQSGVPRTDVLRAGTDLEYRWNREGRDMVYAQYSASRVFRFVEALQITAAYQRPFEWIDRIVATAPSTERKHVDQVRGANFTVQFSSHPRPSHILTYGFEANSDWVTSRRTDVNLATAVPAPVKGNYPDGSRYTAASLFVQDEADLGLRFHAVLGLRRDWFRVTGAVSDPLVGVIDVHSTPAAWTGSGYLLYDIVPSVSAVFGVAQAFRAPNLNDSTVIGGSSNSFEIPNPNLKPEHSINFEYGLRVKTGRANISVVYFDDRYRDLIGSGSGVLGGLSFIDSNGNGVKDGKERNVTRRVNTGSAMVRGVEAEGVVALTDRWTWTQSMTWTHGNDISQGTPLDRIPPVHSVSRLTWQPNKTFWMELSAVAATAQTRLSPADIADIRIGPGGTPGFAVFHLRAGLNRTPLAGLTVAWENLANRRYKFYGSGLERAGTGVVIAYQRAF